MHSSEIGASSVNWDDLRYFLALSRHGSVSAAGQALGVNHTTVARRIAGFEEQLGTRLFDRTRDGYAMTQAAEDIYDKANKMEEFALAIDREVFGRDADLKGTLKLTVPYDFANAVVVRRLPTFRSKYPQIDLELLTTAGLVDLAAREADIALRLTASPPEYLVGRRLMPLMHGVYGSPKFLRSMGDAPDVILFRGSPALPSWVRDNFPGATVALRTDNLGTMLSAVRSGVGLARMPCFEADVDPKVRRLDVPLVPSKWGVWILSHVDLRSTARVRVCREFLAQIVEDERALILGENSRYA